MGLSVRPVGAPQDSITAADLIRLCTQPRVDIGAASGVASGAGSVSMFRRTEMK